MDTRLTSPSFVKELLLRHGLKTQKKLGQNFLIDHNVLQKIIHAAQVTRGDLVLEIGPGLGTMTRALAPLAKKVIAVEADRSLAPVLAETLNGLTNIEVVWQDVLKTNLKHILDKTNGNTVYKVVANLPYYITTPVMFFLLEAGVAWESMVFLVQKEVAERIVSRPGCKEYGLLTVNVKVFGEAEILSIVPPTVFWPEPGVKSAILRIIPRQEKLVPANLSVTFASITRAAFGQRRKTLLRALVNADLGDAAFILKVINESGIKPEARGETLDVNQFITLAGVYNSIRS